MAVRNPTVWSPPSGKGYVNTSSNAEITSQSGISLTSQDGKTLIVNPDLFKPLFNTSWTITSKNKVGWQNQSVVTVGTENLVTNLSQLLTDNLGNFLVTTTTYDKPKNATVWTLSGA